VYTIHAHLSEKSNTLKFEINSPIVEKSIGELLFHPDDMECISHDRAIEIFKFDHISLNYFVEIRKVEQFKLAVRLMAIRNSFRGISKSI
jgi:hypothetical protein